MIFLLLFFDGAMRNNAVDNAVFESFLRGHEIIAVGIARNLLEGLSGGIRNDMIEFCAHGEDLFRLNIERETDK